MISIGTVLQGPELQESAIEHSLQLVTKTAIKVRGNLVIGDRPTVNVVFYVPGSLGKPTFDYPRAGKYSHNQKLLMVQIPVPEEEVSSDTSVHYIIESLYAANAIAFDFYRQRGLDFPLPEAESIVSNIQLQIG